MRALPRLGAVVRRPEAAADEERVRFSPSVWIDARPIFSGARQLAEFICACAETEIQVVELRLGTEDHPGRWLAPTRAELMAQVRTRGRDLPAAAYVFLGEVAGSVIEPDLTVRLGSPSLFSEAPISRRVIRLLCPRADVAAAIARHLDAAPRSPSAGTSA